MRIFSRWVVAAIFFTIVISAGASDFSKWRGVVKAAEQAMTKREFDKARALLEESEGQAAALGPESSAENSLLLGRAYLRMERLEEMQTTLEAALEKVGPNVRSKKLQVWRGFLLGDYSRAHFFLGDMDGAMTNAVSALEILETIGGRGNNETFFLHSMIGDVQAAKKNYAEAETAYKKALRIAYNESTAVGSQWS